MSVFVCSSSTRIHHFRAFLFTCYSPNNKRLHSTFLSYHFGIPIFKQKCDHFCCFQHQNNVYERPLLLFRKNLSLKVNNEQCCYLSGMIRNSGWKAGSWLLFHPKPHHNTLVTHPIACLGHSWGCIVRRNERKRVVNIHFIEYESNVTSSDSAKILSLNDESYFIPFHHYKHCTTPSMSDGRLCESHVC